MGCENRVDGVNRVSFLEKQNEALLRALTKKAALADDTIMQMIIEQQKQILKLSQKIGELHERDALRERQLRALSVKCQS